MPKQLTDCHRVCRMGSGYLRIADRNIVSRSDLHWQHLYDAAWLRSPKIEIAQL